MRTLIMTRGVPASGKSSWADQEARRLALEGRKTLIVCKDDIRRELAEKGWKWSHETEKDVIRERNSRIRTAFGMDIDVVISADCNFGKHKAVLQQLATELHADFVVKDFTSIPVDECVRRDNLREHRVGEKVIRDMYEKYVALPEITPYVANHQKSRALLCDIDGTLALFDGQRSPYDTGKCMSDKLNEPVAELVRELAKQRQVVYVSGREEKFRAQTSTWLARQMMPYGPLFMRATGDHRKDYLVKLELFDEKIRDVYSVDFVLDDRNQVVSMWRKLGLLCLQVQDGDF